MKKATKFIVSKRIIIFAVLGALTYFAKVHFDISIWYIVLSVDVSDWVYDGAVYGRKHSICQYVSISQDGLPYCLGIRFSK